MILEQMENQEKTLDLDRDYENGHWPVREMMKRKFAMIGFYASDAEADEADRFPSGLATIFGTEKTRKEQEWGVLAVWAFAARCVMDYVEQIPEIDAANVAVTGHSRCGKAALWCGANDERFRAVMPNGSGCCGAALSLGKTGENLASIQTFFRIGLLPDFGSMQEKRMNCRLTSIFAGGSRAPDLTCRKRKRGYVGGSGGRILQHLSGEPGMEIL